MLYAFFILVVCFVFVVLLLILLLKDLKKVSDELKSEKDVNKNLNYQINLLKDAEKLKNEARKKAEQKMGGLNYNNVDSAIAILHDNASPD